ncbi:MAG: hypothetical protein OXC44_01825 [Proteobacteria bacterium]|nr:hypothetical protein [Pseudomonadota bacterium]
MMKWMMYVINLNFLSFGLLLGGLIFAGGCKSSSAEIFKQPSHSQLQGIKDRYYTLILKPMKHKPSQVSFMVCHRTKEASEPEQDVQVFIGIEAQKLCVHAFMDSQGEPVSFAKETFILEGKQALDAYYMWVKRRAAKQKYIKEQLQKDLSHQYDKNDLALMIASGITITATMFFAVATKRPWAFGLTPLALVVASPLHGINQRLIGYNYRQELKAFQDCERVLQKGLKARNSYEDHIPIQETCALVGVQLPLSQQSLGTAGLQLEDMMHILDRNTLHDTSVRIPDVIGGLAKLINVSGWGNETTDNLYYHCLPSEIIYGAAPNSMCLTIEEAWPTGDNEEYIKPKERRPATGEPAL